MSKSKHEETIAPAALPAEPPPPSGPLKEGDKVKHIAPGSPLMAVLSVSDLGYDVSCQWFGTDGAYYYRVFHKDQLIRA